jgi:hypothetical protein
MLLRLIATLCLVLAFLGCHPTDSNETANISLPTTVSPNALPLFKQQFPRLSDLLQNDTITQKVVSQYAYRVLQQNDTSDTSLEQLIDQRAIIIVLLHSKVLDPFFSKNDAYYNSESGTALETELNRMGIKTFAAEGIYIGLAPATLLEANFRKYASQPLYLYQQFITASGNSMGGEYPYSNLQAQRAMINIGEQLTHQYPQHQYTKKIQSEFNTALRVLTDVHTVQSSTSGVMYIVSDLLFQPYPTATSDEQYAAFIKEYPDSKYSSLIKNIYEHPSEIRLNDDEVPQPIYLVIIDSGSPSMEYADCQTLDPKRKDFLDKGIDIPHLFPIKKSNNDMECVLCYRFFADPNKAQKARETIKKRLNSREIQVRKAVFSTETQTWVLE